jgi:hypothetical protein
MCGGPIAWCSRKQPTVALSTAVSEYMAAADAAVEGIWIKNLLSEIGIWKEGPLLLHEDNTVCKRLAENPEHVKRAKHIDIKHHFLRDRVGKGDIQIIQVPTTEMLADILTKALPQGQFVKLRTACGLLSDRNGTGGVLECSKPSEEVASVIDPKGTNPEESNVTADFRLQAPKPRYSSSAKLI